MSDVLDFAKKAVPWITAAASGNVPALVGLAAEAVSRATGVNIEPTKEAVVHAVAGATQAELLAMKQEEDNFALRMQEFGYKQTTELYASEIADRDSARKRDVELMKVTGHTNHRADVMLGLTFLGLVALITMMFIRNVDANSALGGIVVLTIGKLLGQWDTGFSFEFGSNRSSKGKDETIKALTK